MTHILKVSSSRYGCPGAAENGRYTGAFPRARKGGAATILGILGNGLAGCRSQSHMKKARYGSVGGPLVDPMEFIQRATPEYKAHGIFPYCDACREIVHLYGVHTPNPKIKARFDHANRATNSDPLDDCILANRNSQKVQLVSDGCQDVYGRKMRDRFFTDENLSVAYGFCCELCRNRNLLTDKFLSMLSHADEKKVWSYVGIPLWAIPYILLTMENFIGYTKGRREYQFHFVLNKPNGADLSAVWQQPQNCDIVKLFSDGGRPVKANDNPYPISEEALIAKAGDTSRITPEFLQLLRA